MSFSKAFQDIFASIFRSPHRPRLRRCFGKWQCSSGGTVAYGETPMRAYAVWWGGVSK